MKKVNGTDLIHGDAAIRGGTEVAPSISVTTSKELIASTPQNINPMDICSSLLYT